MSEKTPYQILHELIEGGMMIEGWTDSEGRSRTRLVDTRTGEVYESGSKRNYSLYPRRQQPGRKE